MNTAGSCRKCLASSTNLLPSARHLAPTAAGSKRSGRLAALHGPWNSGRRELHSAHFPIEGEQIQWDLKWFLRRSIGCPAAMCFVGCWRRLRENSTSPQLVLRTLQTPCCGASPTQTLQRCGWTAPPLCNSKKLSVKRVFSRWLAAMPECWHAWVAGLCSFQTDFGPALSPAEMNPDLPTKAPIAVKFAFAGALPAIFRCTNWVWCPYVGNECAQHSRWAVAWLTNSRDQWHLASSTQLAWCMHSNQSWQGTEVV